MIEVGAFEAKTRFSELLKNVTQGETVLITKHGEEVALLIPVKKSGQRLTSAAQAVETIKMLRKGVTLGRGLSIKKMKEIGRK